MPPKKGDTRRVEVLLEKLPTSLLGPGYPGGPLDVSDDEPPAAAAAAAAVEEPSSSFTLSVPSPSSVPGPLPPPQRRGRPATRPETRPKRPRRKSQRSLLVGRRASPTPPSSARPANSLAPLNSSAMSARPRRGEAASKADRHGTHYSQEINVLRAQGPHAKDDEWPSYELADAIVLDKDGQTVVNALDVLVKGPFIVRGRLIAMSRDEDEHGWRAQKQQLIKKISPTHGEHIEIPQCRQLSIGEAPLPEFADPARSLGAAAIWLQGRAAWYELSPCPQYAETYRSIYQSIRLYYGIYTVYEGTRDAAGRVRPRLVEGRKSTSGIDRMQDLFARCALKIGNGMTIEEVEGQCNEAAPLLVQWFVQGSDPHIWPGTYFQKWILQQHPGLVQRTEKALADLYKTATPAFAELPTRARTKSKTPVVHDEPAETDSRMRSTRSGSAHITSPPPGPRDTGEKRRSKESQSSLEQVQTAPSMDDPIPPAQDQPMLDAPAGGEKGGQDALDTVVTALEEARAEINPKKVVSFTAVAGKIYFAYKWPTFKNGKPGCHKVPIEEVLHYNAPALLQRLDKNSWAGPFLEWLKEVSTKPLELEALKPSDLPYTLERRKAKEPTTRAPIPAEAASSSKAVQPQDDDHDDSNELETPRRPGKGVKTPARLGKSTLRPVITTNKRDFEDLDSDSEEESPAAKRVQQEYGALSSDEEDKIQLVIRADKILSTAPRGRDETWICDEEDCNYVVRGGDAEACQQRIEAHFQEHQDQGERMQLAMTEGTRGHLPINHLLEKIKQIGESAEATEENKQQRKYSQTLPKRIQRRLIM